MLTIQPQIKVGTAFQTCPVKQFRGGVWVDLYGGGATGFTVCKTYQVSAGRESPVLDWVEIDVVDPAFCGACNGVTDLGATLSDGTEIAATILAASATRVSCMVGIPGRLCDPNTLVEVNLYTGKTGGHTFAGSSLSTGKNIADTDACGPTVRIAKNAAGLDAVTTDEWVHGQVLRVPDGSWLEDVGGGSTGTVTHVCVATPYPSADDDFENPYLLYSEDEGVSWQVWPHFDESTYFSPLADFPGGTAFLSDCSMAIIGAELCVFYRHTTSRTTPVITMRRIAVTGTDLSTVTVGAEAVVHGECLSPVVGYDGTVLYMFDVEALASDPARREIVRYESIDAGISWTNRTVAIVEGGFPYRTFWHIGLSAEPINGYWYMLASEVVYDGKPHTTGSVPRLFRSASLANWEAVYEADAGLFTPQAGNGSLLNAFYQGNVYPASNGTPIASMFWKGASSTYRWFRIADVLMPQAMTAARYFGLGYSDLNLAERTALVLSDFESDGINNRGTGGAYVISGAPTQEADGVSFDGVDDSITPQIAGASLKLGSRGPLTIMADITLDASAADQKHPIIVDTDDGTVDGIGFRLEVQPSASIARACAVFYESSVAYGDVVGTSDLKGKRTLIQAVQEKPFIADNDEVISSRSRLYVDSNMEAEKDDGADSLRLTTSGMDVAASTPVIFNNDHGRFKLHALAVYEGNPRSRSYFATHPRVRADGVAVGGNYEI